MAAQLRNMNAEWTAVTKEEFLKKSHVFEYPPVEKGPEPFKAWVYSVLSVTFLAAALYQSSVFTMKFIAKPTTTSYDFERFDSLELPSFTVCASPSLHFEKAESMADANPEIPDLFERFPMMSLSYPVRLLPRLNMTFPEFIRKTGASLMLTRSQCLLNNKRSIVCTPTHGFPMGEDIEQNFRLLRPMPTGVWETRIVHSNDAGDSFRLCDTFTSNLTLPPGSESGLEITFMSAPKAFILSNRAVANRTGWVNRTRDFAKPYWGIYFHSKDEPKIAYDSLERMEKIVIRPFTRVEIGLSMKKFNMLPSSSRPCEPSSNYSYVECEEHCAERLLPCVLLKRRTNPGFLSRHFSPTNVTNLGGKRECKMRDYEDYSTTYNLQFKRLINFTMTSACCPAKCSEVHYDYRVVTTEDSDPKLLENLDFSDLTKSRGFKATALIYWRTSNVEIIQHEYSYSFTQYLGELGGTWGLFLGVSIISVLQFLEHLFALILRCRLRGNDKEGF